jgi:hypothetical protein
MSTLEPVVMTVDEDQPGYVQWGPVIAGALAAAAISFVLHSFASAIGLAVSSPAPTWRDSSAMLQLLSGIYLLLVAVIAFGVGGYLAGRMRARVGMARTEDEIEFRDGTHGLLVWAIAILITGIFAWAAVQSLTRLAAPSGGQPGSAQSVAGENLIAYDLDRLFRSDKRPRDVDLSYARSEAARILLTTAGHSGITSDDRAYLVRLTSANTGLSQAEADKRVATVIEQARDNIRKARRSAIILAFMAGASALLGAAIAWFAACAGGQHRDGRSAPSMQWGFGGPRLTPERPRV